MKPVVPSLPIYQITLPTPFQVGDVHCWLIKDDKIVLVDCGPQTPEARNALADGLAALDLRFSDIDELWLTHGHPDHFGLAKQLNEGFTLPTAAHEADVFLYENLDLREHQATLFKKYGVPEPHIEHYKVQWEWFMNYFRPMRPNRFLSEGQLLSTGKHQFEVLHVPGHAPGHLAFRECYSNTIIAGDVLIDHISSNAIFTIDLISHQRIDTLSQLRESMRRLGELESTILPGHGRIFSHPEQVVARHFADHDKRLETLLRHLERPKSVYELSLDLFPFSKDPRISFLTISEVLGHLDRGVQEKLLAMDASSGYYFRS